MDKRTFIRSLGITGLGLLASKYLYGAGGELNSAIDELTFPSNDGKFSLPELPYDYKALEPYIDAQTMEIHHSKHHQGYVNNLNKALEGTTMATWSLEKILANANNTNLAVRNNAGGHYNHSLFWQMLTPKGSGNPSGILATAIDNNFGSFDKFKEKFAAAGTGQFGSGWAWLVKGANNKLYVYSTPNQDAPIMTKLGYKGRPLLGIDVWEHAYYLKYQNKRGEYISNFWNIVNWDKVSELYAAK